MRTYIILFFILLASGAVEAQHPAFDRLEMNYAQRHYRRVYRLSDRMLDKPEYDFSIIPSYYKSISLFQLCQNDHWRELHPKALDRAKELFLNVKRSQDGEKLFNSHMYELSWLKGDMESWASDLKRKGETHTFDQVNNILTEIFSDVPEVDAGNDANHSVDTIPSNSVPESAELAGIRGQIVELAKTHIGTPYVWAGSSPEGFDCSGFTLYVMKENGASIPRRSGEQYESSKKLKAEEAQPGDLVFFNNGSGISHVGIVISGKDKPLVMIHSSSSKGIVITEVEKSQYWMSRLHGYGTYIH